MVMDCQILIKKPKTGVYYPGQTVTGTVKYTIGKPTEFKDIVISLFGKGKCRWKETKRRNGSNVIVYYTGTEEYFNDKKSLIDKKGDTTLIDVGSYEQDFEFLLPDNIPSTYKDYHCDIVYCLKLKFYKSGFFSSNKRYTAEINVQGYASVDNENPIIIGLEKSLSNIFSSKNKTVKLKSQVDKRLFMPGEVANLRYEVVNDSDIIIPKVKTELVAYKVYTANCGRKKPITEVVKGCKVNSPSIPDNSTANLSSSVPILDNLYSLQNTKVFQLEYKLKVTVKLPMPYTNVSVEAPIVIGYKFTSENMNEADENPPSYWEAMQEELDKTDDEDK